MGAAGSVTNPGDGASAGSRPPTRWAFALALGLLTLRLATLGSWPLTDTTEGRYGAIAHSMAESGD